MLGVYFITSVWGFIDPCGVWGHVGLVIEPVFAAHNTVVQAVGLTPTYPDFLWFVFF